MKKILSLLLFLFIMDKSYSQIKKTTLSLQPIEIKMKELSFSIQDVEISSFVSDTLGIISTRKGKETILAMMPEGKKNAIKTFLESQFIQNKKGTAIILEITKMGLTPVEKGHFNPKDLFQLECTFWGIINEEKTLLYNFKAKNEFGNFEDAPTVFGNYISRALVSGVEKFKESYDKKAEWHNEFQNASLQNQKPIKVNCVYNKIKQTDSIPCNFGNQIDWNMFQENKKENTDMGSAKFILTYKVESEETNKQLKLDIYVNAFLNKRTSWRPKNIQNNTWLEYQQGHFDICAVYGNQLFQKMKTYPYNLGTFKTELNTIYNTIYIEYTRIRKEYADATQNGNNENEIKKWRQKINKMILDQNKN